MRSLLLVLLASSARITWEREDAKEAHYRGIFDDRGRLMAIFADNDYYFKEFSLKKAYPTGNQHRFARTYEVGKCDKDKVPRYLRSI